MAAELFTALHNIVVVDKVIAHAALLNGVCFFFNCLFVNRIQFRINLRLVCFPTFLH